MATTVATIATTALSPAISTSAVATAIGRIPTSNATARHVPSSTANHGDATTNRQCKHPAKAAWAFYASLVFHLHWLVGRPSSCLGCVCALCAGCDYSAGRDVAESAPNGHHSAQELTKKAHKMH